MRENTLKARLNDRKAAFGVMITFPSAPVVEMLGHLGFDWVLIGNEHGSITVDNSEDLIRAAEFSGIAPIVRPVANRPDDHRAVPGPRRLGRSGAPREHRRVGQGGRGRGVVLSRRPSRDFQPQPSRRLRVSHNGRRVRDRSQPQHPGMPDAGGGRSHRQPGVDGSS